MEAPRGIPGKRDPRDGGEATCPELMTQNLLEMNTDSNPPAGSTEDERKDEKRAQTSASSTQQAREMPAPAFAAHSGHSFPPALPASLSQPAILSQTFPSAAPRQV